VKALNKEGESEPLETFGSIVAKDPFSKWNICYSFFNRRYLTSVIQ
jgi:hypothetical protein